MLNGRDKAKLQAAGFRIFYMVRGEKCIKEQVNGSFRVHSRHTTQAAMNSVFAELMKDPMHIEN